MVVSWKRFYGVMLFLTAASFLTSCDLISPPKKANKATPAATEQSTKTEAVANPAVNENEGPMPADVVARVGSWKLTIDELNSRLKLLKQGLPNFNENDPQTKASVVDELIRQQLLVKEAESTDVAEQKEIKDAVEDFRRTLLVQELANRITKGVEATQEDAQKYYNDNKNLFLKWKVRQIVVPEEATAKNILVQVLQGGDFASIAKEQSKDATAATGGLIEDPTKAPVEVQKAILPLEAGGTSAVFKVGSNFHIVHVDEKTVVPFADVKANVINGLTLRKQQNAILEYINKLAQKNKVDVNKELLGLNEAKQDKP